MMSSPLEEDGIQSIPLHDTGHDRAVWCMFCKVRDKDGDRKPGDRFHIYFVRRMRNLMRGVVLEDTRPVLGRWPAGPREVTQ